MTIYTCPNCGLVRNTLPRPIHDHNGQRVPFVSDYERVIVGASASASEPAVEYPDPFADDEPDAELVAEPVKPARKRTARTRKTA